MDNRRNDDTDEILNHVIMSEESLNLHRRVTDIEISMKLLVDSNRELVDNVYRLTESTSRIAEVLEAWASAKGFINTLRFFSMMGKLLLPIVGLGVALWFFGKTGHWDWK